MSSVYLTHTFILIPNMITTISYILVLQTTNSSNKRGRVCNYQINVLALRILYVQYLQESICFKPNIGDQTCNLVSLCRSSSQGKDKFENSKTLELNLGNLVLKNPFLVVAIGDFNAKSKNWFCQDKTSIKGNVIEKLP